MAVLAVRTIGDPVLDTRAEPVTEIDDGIRKLLDDMLETMRVEKGIGLAAPQVGVSRRLAVIELDGKILDLVNPRIVATRGRSRGMEACLSVPDLEGEVERADWIRVEYLDRQGQPQAFEAQGLMARCIQHELDHLDGMLFVNRLSAARRMLLQRRIKELRQETRRKLAAAG